MTTLTLDATTIDLPDDMLWPDEFEWRPIEASRRFSISGVPITDRGIKQAGRPITLTDAWLPRGTVEDLIAWAETADAELTLVYRSVSRTVRFDHTVLPVEATAIVDYADPVDADSYAVTLRFIET
jgi:hypothetical protein